MGVFRRRVVSAAVDYGWTPLADRTGDVDEFVRDAEHLWVYYSGDDAVRVVNFYPTGDRHLITMEPVMGTRIVERGTAPKNEVVLAWLAEVHKARPGVNEILRKLGIDTVLDDGAQEEGDAGGCSV